MSRLPGWVGKEILSNFETRMEQSYLASSRRTNQTNGTMVTKTLRLANALQICSVPAGMQLPKSHKGTKHRRQIHK